MSNQVSRSINTLLRQPISVRAYRYCNLRASGADPTAAARGAGYKQAKAAAAYLEEQPVINQLITKLVNNQGRSFILNAEERARLLSAIAADNTASPADRIRAMQLLQRIEETTAAAGNGGNIELSWKET